MSTATTAVDDYRLAVEINNALRKARLNVIYYGWRLDRMRKWERAVEIVVAVGTSAAIASLAVWRNDIGRTTFNVVVAAAAVAVVVKPVLGLAAAVTRLSKMWVTYNGSLATLARLSTETKLRNALLPGAKARLLDAVARMASVRDEEDWAPPAKWVALAQDLVERELPPGELWYPPGCDFTALPAAA